MDRKYKLSIALDIDDVITLRGESIFINEYEINI